MTASDRKRQKRQAARSIGHCIECYLRPALEGRAKCQQCNKRDADGWRERNGYAPDERGRHCSECHDRSHDVRTCPDLVRRRAA